MELWDGWDNFLKVIASDHNLTVEQKAVFLVRLSRQKLTKKNQEIADKVIRGDPNNAFSAYNKRMEEVFNKLSQSFPEINSDSKKKVERTRTCLEKAYLEQQNNKNYEASVTDIIASLPSWRSRFQALIDDKTKDFVGRTYVFDAIANFLTNQPNGYFIIEGDPGMGKSAILAEYVRRTGCVAHFNVQGEYETVEEFLKTLRAELTGRYKLAPPPIPADVKQYGSFLNELLAEVAQNRNGERVVIAIDALDEVDSANQPTTGNILHLPRYLHEGIYFLMTRRRGVEIPFITDAPQELFKMMDYKNQSREDVRTYINNRANGSELLRQRIAERGETETDFIDKITDKSENNFMYLVYVLQGIENGLYQDLSLEMFPQGLEQYYEFHWRDMGMTAKPRPVTKINIVYHLAESHQPLSRQLVAEYVDELELTVQEVLDEWEQFLHKQSVEQETCYSVYHASFRDFLHRKDIVQAAGVSLKAIKKQKSDTLWEAMFGDE